MSSGPYAFDEIFAALVNHCIINLPEWRKKQLAAILIHHTLNPMGSEEIFNYLKKEVTK
jgi:hypothetical protein